MISRNVLFLCIFAGATGFMAGTAHGSTITYEAAHASTVRERSYDPSLLLRAQHSLPVLAIAQEHATSTVTKAQKTPDAQRAKAASTNLHEPEDAAKEGIFEVPFYSQFADISSPKWKKVGCGITGLAMLIDYYEPHAPSVDTLLKEGIAAHAYSDAGWTYSGLISVSKKYGLSGESHDLSMKSMGNAFDALQKELRKGPVMVSVHYTFNAKNPIPHLVIATGIKNGMLYYNDPAAKTGDLSISVETFKSAWKKRYVTFYPVS